MDKELIEIQDLFKKILTTGSESHKELFKKLIWNVIGLKEDKIDYGEVRDIIENCHILLLKELVNYLSPRVDNIRYNNFSRNSNIKKSLINWFGNVNGWKLFLHKPNWSVFRDRLLYNCSSKDYLYHVVLVHLIFPELGIDENDLILETRNYYRVLSKGKEHSSNKIINPKSIDVTFRDDLLFRSTFFLFLLTELIIEIKSKVKNDVFKNSVVKVLNGFSINSRFPNLSSLDNNSLIDCFMDLLFSERETRDLTFKNIFTNNDIKNHTILQNIYPSIYLNPYRIQELFKSNYIEEFRVDGPYFKDYDEGNWIFTPKIKNTMQKILDSEQSILIEGESGSGKSVLARILGYDNYKNMEKLVFYFELLDFNDDQLGKILEYLSRMVENKEFSNNNLLIFDNIHPINKNLCKQLNSIVNSYTCILVRRNQSKDNQNNEKERNTIDGSNFKFQIKKENVISLKSSFFEIKRGVIRTYTGNPIEREQFENLPINNLWMISFILKIFRYIRSEGKDITIPALLSDRNQFYNELKKYFENLYLKDRVELNYKESQKARIFEHLRLFIVTLSVFSENESWISRNFIYSFLKLDVGIIKDIKEKIDYSDEIISDMIKFLVSIKQIKYKELDDSGEFNLDGFRVPHKILATIYKNIFTNGNQLYKKLIPQIYGHYILNANEDDFFSFIWALKYPENKSKDKLREDISKYLKNEENLINISNKLFKSLDKNYFIRYLGNIKSIFPEYWKILANRISSSFKTKPESFEEIIYSLNYPSFLDLLEIFKSSLGRKDFIRKLLKIKDTIMKKIKMANIYELFQHLHLFLNWKNKNNYRNYFKKQIEIIISSIKNKDFNDLKEIFNKQNREVMQVLYYISQGSDEESSLYQNLLKLILEKHFFQFNIQDYLEIFSKYSRFGFLKEDWLLYYQNFHDRNLFWQKFESKFADTNIKSILSFLFDINDILSEKTNESAAKSFLVDLYNNLSSIIISKIKNDKINEHQRSRIEFINGLLEPFNQINLYDDLCNNELFNSFEWIFDILKSESIWDMKKNSSNLYWKITRIFPKEKSDDFLKELSNLFDHKLEELEESFKSIEDYMNFYQRFIEHGVDSYLKDKIEEFLRKIINLYVENGVLNTSIFNLIPFNRIKDYLDIQGVRILIENAYTDEIILFLDDLRELNLLNYKQVFKIFKDIFKRKLLSDYKLFESGLFPTERNNIKKFQEFYRSHNSIQILKQYSEWKIDQFMDMSRHIELKKLEENEFNELYDWLITQPFEDTIINLLKIHTIYLNYLEKFDPNIHNELFRILTDSKNTEKIRILFFLDSLDVSESDDTMNQPKRYTWDVNFRYIEDFYNLSTEFFINATSYWTNEINTIELAYLPKIVVNNIISSKTLLENVLKISNLSQICYIFLRRAIFYHSHHQRLVIARNDSNPITLNRRFDHLLSTLPKENFKDLINFYEILEENFKRYFVDGINENQLKIKNNYLQIGINLNYLLCQDELIELLIDDSSILQEKIENSDIFGILLLTKFLIYVKEIINESYFDDLLQIYKENINNNRIIEFIENYLVLFNRFDIINQFFGFLYIVEPNFASNLWNNCKEFFISNEFINNIKNTSFSKLIEFYLRFNIPKSTNEIEEELHSFLKERLKNLTFGEFKSFIYADEITIEHINCIKNLFSAFIENNIKHYTKGTIEHNLSLFNNILYKKEEQRNLKDKFIMDLVKEKLNETYFFDEYFK